MREIILRLSTLDRRIIYLALVLGIVLPLLFPLRLVQVMSPPTKKVYDFIENLPEGSVLVYSIDYGPSVLPEVHPMVLAMLRHAFLKNHKVIALALHHEGVGLGLEALDKVAKEFGKKYGEDYVYLGYKAGVSGVILGLGESVKKVFPVDYFGTPVESLPLMRGVRNYDDIALVVSFSGAALPAYWVTYANTGYGQDIAAGVTAVNAAEYFVYLQTGQMIGLLGGMKGAAEYEAAVERRLKNRPTPMAVRGMDGIAIAHLLMIVLIILGNVGYFLQRRK